MNRWMIVKDILEAVWKEPVTAVKIQAQKVPQHRKTTTESRPQPEYKSNQLPIKYKAHMPSTTPLHHSIHSTDGRTTCIPWDTCDLPNLAMQPI